MLSVIGLPVVLPIAALVQLLFPGVLREQWRQYRVVVQVLLAQSTLIFVHWALLRWFVAQPSWWLSDAALWDALLGVACVGAVWAVLHRPRPVNGAASAVHSPARIEFWAFGILAVAGLAWAAYGAWRGASPWDSMAVVTIAAFAATFHLIYRRVLAAMPSFRVLLTTELVFLTTQIAAGAAVGAYLQRAPRNAIAAEVTDAWPTFRQSVRRTGVASDDAALRHPTILWTFTPKEPTGRVLIHSSPAVIGNQVYVGAMHQTLGGTDGLVYCIAVERTADGASPGQRLWTFSAGDTLKAVFSSPAVAGGRLYIGEGYHQDQECRLFCLDARRGDKAIWSLSTGSHVESSPTIDDGRLYFGAGDDGLLCVALPSSSPSTEEGRPAVSLSNGGEGEAVQRPTKSIAEPELLWQVPGLHIDSSPAVADRRVFAGSVIGDEHQDLFAICVHAKSGKVIWKIPSPLPLAGSPAYAAGRVCFALGNGKLNVDADKPDGRIWCLDAKGGDRLWEFRAAGSILSSPAVLDGTVYCCSRDRHCYALQQSDGAVIWKRDLGEPIVASPAVTRRSIYVLTVGGALYCLDSATGEPIWRFDELKNDEDDAYSSPTLAAGRLYVASGGKLFCVGDKSGQ
jgi:outer membrane protein assembly factor BamB